MVEMRWVTRDEKRTVGIDDKFYVPALPDTVSIKVLQYRYFISGFLPSGQWSSWIDVPTVTEGKNNG